METIYVFMNSGEVKKIKMHEGQPHHYICDYIDSKFGKDKWNGYSDKQVSASNQSK